MTQEGKDLLETLYREVESMTSGDDWKRALDVAAKFHSYSFRNTLLILLQTDGKATRVAGYKKWQEMGRQVKKGERSIRILAPVVVKKRDEETGEERRVLVGFRGVGVFDIAQTEGDELPTLPMPELLEGEAPVEGIAAVVALLEADGWTVNLKGESLQGENGYTEYGRKYVQVTAGLSDAQTFKTLVHEYAHARLHGPEGEETQGDARFHRGMAEVQADSAAYVACGGLGLDSSSYSFAYVAGWSGGDAKAVLKMADGALKVAATVIDAVRERQAALVAA